MTREEAQRELQARLAELKAITEGMVDLALTAGVDYVEFLGHQIRFAIDGDPAHDRTPRITDAEWRSSSFECYPSDGDWEWFHGPNPPPKPYEGYY